MLRRTGDPELAADLAAEAFAAALVAVRRYRAGPAPAWLCSESVVRQRVSRGLATLREISEEAP
jgi:sigma-70-like protein